MKCECVNPLCSHEGGCKKEPHKFLILTPSSAQTKPFYMCKDCLLLEIEHGDIKLFEKTE